MIVFLRWQNTKLLFRRSSTPFGPADSLNKLLDCFPCTFPLTDTAHGVRREGRFVPCFSSISETPSRANEELEAILKERDELREEARQITLSFYRTCIRCVRSIRQGNERDERQFQEREAARLSGGRNTFSFEPPVDRGNELNSRADYYLDHAQEEVFQESDCLDDEFWSEETYERYLYFIKRGEYKRTWLLKDYDFDDPYPNSFDNKRLADFEQRAKELVRRQDEYKSWARKNQK